MKKADMLFLHVYFHLTGSVEKLIPVSSILSLAYEEEDA